METKRCIYCGRTLDADRLLERAGTYRCKDENDCLEYQAGDDPADAADNGDYMAELAASSLAGAAERIEAYGRAVADSPAGVAGGGAEASDDVSDEALWMKAALEALAQALQEKKNITFRFSEGGQPLCTLSVGDADPQGPVTAEIRVHPGSGFSFTAAAGGGTQQADPLYREFIYKTYPDSRREDLIGDLSVFLLAFEGEKDRLPAALHAFRREIEARCCHDGEGNE